MALAPALGIGVAAGFVSPILVREAPGTLGGLMAGSAVHLPGTGVHFVFSWPVFVAATLLVWVLLAAGRDR